MDIYTIQERIEDGAYDVPAEDVAEAILRWISPTVRAERRPEAGARQSTPPSERP